MVTPPDDTITLSLTVTCYSLRRAALAQALFSSQYLHVLQAVMFGLFESPEDLKVCVCV